MLGGEEEEEEVEGGDANAHINKKKTLQFVYVRIMPACAPRCSAANGRSMRGFLR